MKYYFFTSSASFIREFSESYYVSNGSHTNSKVTILSLYVLILVTGVLNVAVQKVSSKWERPLSVISKSAQSIGKYGFPVWVVIFRLFIEWFFSLCLKWIRTLPFRIYFIAVIVTTTQSYIFAFEHGGHLVSSTTAILCMCNIEQIIRGV